ncbi:MAG: PilN domain-containing protein, partial [Candidatus Omnitrophica bacterium]|nr:PilN domain-containing protein [Candidatus Omnitrophota bacterium]
EQVIKNRILWSKKLNQLSELMVSGIWLNELKVEPWTKVKVQPLAQAKGQPLKYLIIQGSCASRTKDEPALIGRFMQNLKDDPLFSSDFAEIELGPIEKRLINQTAVMDFILTCRFKQEKVSGLVK